MQYSIEYILSLKRKNVDVPDIDSKYLVKYVKKQMKPKYEFVKKMEHTIENPWIRNNDKEETEIKRGKIISLLNKLSENKLDKIVTNVKEINITSEEDIKMISLLLYNKCIEEPIFIKVYVDFIKKYNNNDVTNIIFDNVDNKMKEEVKEINEESVERKRKINNMILMGYMYNVDLAEDIEIEHAFDYLFDINDLEAVIIMIKIIKNKYGSAKDNKLHSYLEKLNNCTNVSSKVKFARMDLNEDKKIIVIKKEQPELKTKIKTIVKEYLCTLECEELIECYNEMKINESQFISVFIDIYVNENEKKNNDLIELIKILIKRNLVTVETTIKQIRLINIKEYKLDIPNIDKLLEKLLESII